MDVDDLVFNAHLNGKLKGFWDEQRYTLDEVDTRLDYTKVLQTVPEKLCLIHSEVSEALEAYRAGRNTTMALTGKPEGLPSELADVVIRVADLCGALGIDLDAEIRRKMEYNSGRPRKHGKVC